MARAHSTRCAICRRTPRELTPYKSRCATSSETRSPCRYASRISVRSRSPWRPTLAEAFSSFSTSSGVRYSLERLDALDCRRGGRGESGVARDRLPEAFVVRPLEVTFPFSSIGDFFGAGFFLAWPSPNSSTRGTPPLRVASFMGKIPTLADASQNAGSRCRC
jgi:hypothetical protein